VELLPDLEWFAETVQVTEMQLIAEVEEEGIDS
jgi:hypothetical protein